MVSVFIIRGPIENIYIDIEGVQIETYSDFKFKIRCFFWIQRLILVRYVCFIVLVRSTVYIKIFGFGSLEKHSPPDFQHISKGISRKSENWHIWLSGILWSTLLKNERNMFLGYLGPKKPVCKVSDLNSIVITIYQTPQYDNFREFQILESVLLRWFKSWKF